MLALQVEPFLRGRRRKLGPTGFCPACLGICKMVRVWERSWEEGNGRPRWDQEARI